MVPDASLPLERQFFQWLCLLGGAISILIILPVNNYQGLSPWVNRGIAVFGLLLLGVAWAAKRGRYLLKTTLVSLVLCLDLLWFPNGGSRGSIGLYFFLAVLFLVLFFKGRSRMAGLLLLLADLIGLFFMEWAWPQLVSSFPSEAARFVDLVAGYLICLPTCALMLWVIQRGFERERDRLTDSEGMYREFLERQGEGFSMVDAEERFQLANPVAERIFGVPPGGLAGRSLLDFLPEDQRDLLRAESRIRAEGKASTYELQIRRADGALRTLLITATPRSNPGAETLQVLGVFRDITERREAEDRLKESEERYRTQFDRASEGILALSPEGDLLEVNEAMARMHGYTREEMLALNLRDLEAWDAPSLPPERMERLLAGETLTFEVEHVRKNGHALPLEVSASLVSTGGRAVLLCFHRDITERKQAEETARLLVQEKQQTQKMESLGSLAGGVAHDFNNMLGGIMGYADLLMAGEADPIRQKYLKAILAASSRSAELTQKLLAFGRRGKNLVEALDLQAMVHDCLDMIRPSMSPDLQVVVSMEGCPTVDGDPSQIHQVLVNLCINAMEAMPEGGVLALSSSVCEVSAATHPGLSLPAGRYVELSVSDTGLGMSREIQQRIFEPFFTTKNSSGLSGTGLGLSTAYGIILAHGGAITVASSKGRGSTFRLFLPVGSVPPAGQETGPGAACGEGLVLLVEDEQMLRELGAAALETLGYEAVTAADGREAVEAYGRLHGRLGAVLLDLKMPRMGGREAFIEIRRIDPTVPVIICTGYGENEEVQELLTLGARGMLAKPYQISSLAAKLRHVLAG
ncbi:MAG: PAS domain S-box protein [Holophagaceae bacterium]